MRTDHIKAHWDKQAKLHNASFAASWGDLNIIRLEIDNIAKHLGDNDKVLDVGCANGFAAFSHLDNGLKSITGIDYSQNMVEEAKKAAQSKGVSDRAKFETADIQAIPFKDNSFDVVYTTRVLINLPNWESQKKGISECLRVAKKGGTVIFSEAFWEPLTKLNSLRVVAGLSPLKEPDFNRYLKEETLQSHFESDNIPFTISDFSSIYYIGSRFVRDLVQDRKADVQGFENPFNEAFLKIEQGFTAEQFGIQKAYAVTKK